MWSVWGEGNVRITAFGRGSDRFCIAFDWRSRFYSSFCDTHIWRPKAYKNE
jgi:hypothetical protein